MREMKAGEERDRARFSATRLLEDLDEQWPSMKFLGFGAYYAWIFLSYNSDVLFGWSGASVGGNAMSVMYLASTTALGLVLIVAGAFQKVTARIVESRLSVTVLAGMATLATLVVAWSAPAQAGEALYVAGCSLTGVGTAFVALRLGSVYSTVGARQAFMYTAGSFIFAGMLYFVCIGLPQPVGLLMAASLPLLAVVFTMAAVRAPSEPAEDVVPVRELPRGYFIRLVVAVSVFSVIDPQRLGQAALLERCDDAAAEAGLDGLQHDGLRGDALVPGGEGVGQRALVVAAHHDVGARPLARLGPWPVGQGLRPRAAREHALAGALVADDGVAQRLRVAA